MDANPKSPRTGSTARMFSYFCPPGLDAEEVRKRQHVIVFLLIGVVVLFPIAAVHLTDGDYSTGLINLGGGCVFAGMLFALHFLKKALVLFRLTAGFLFSILVYNFIVGGQNGSMILWTYIFPAVAFLILGKREGLVWILLLYGITFALELVPSSYLTVYPYPLPMKLRFWISFPIVALFSWVIESFRQKYSDEKQTLIVRLEDALLEIKTLEGILPICSHCKKIRDESDRWQPVDTYVREHTQATFTHSICPDCLRTHYPFIQPE